MCYFGNINEACLHSECFMLSLLVANFFYQQELTNLSNLFNSCFEQFSDFLNTLKQENQNAHNNLDLVHQNLKQLSSTLKQTRKNKLHLDEIDTILEQYKKAKSHWEFPLSIEPLQSFPKKLSKETPFNLSFKLIDKEGKSHAIQEEFVICFLTKETEPKVMVTSLNKKPFLRGSFRTYQNGNGTVSFQRLVLNEVSSHHKHGTFICLVACLSSDQVRPFLFENLKVKARRAKTKR